MFIIMNSCIGRDWMSPLKRKWADLICWIVGHDRDYPPRCVWTVRSDGYATCICIRCYKGGYDDGKMISSGGVAI